MIDPKNKDQRDPRVAKTDRWGRILETRERMGNGTLVGRFDNGTVWTYESDPPSPDVIMGRKSW